MTFTKESDFEEALIKVLTEKGWEKEILKNYTEKDLIKNWAKILYDNNRGIDRLNNYPLTDGEMEQILNQINNLRTPLKLNGFINGKTVSIKRDNPDDTLHFGREISLKIYDRGEIAAGQSRYQIVQQPKFPTNSPMLNDRRGDLMLLINGMPVIHIELKRSGVPVSQAYHQIEKYAHEGIFSGLFSLVQIFVAMNPDETVYFANPGPDGKFRQEYYFHWADFNNEPINDWKAIASSLLSIPMAHQLIGFYTVADDSDGVLKVMRSYQYYAASAISDKVVKTKWGDTTQLGGYIWHTTGSGKTMTSFKSAQLIANGNDADKVIFLTDRIELGTQSLLEYRSFADDKDSVQATENTHVLLTKLKSKDVADTLIVTSIQKMSKIKDEEGGLNTHDMEIINKKRIVFIVDEAHRSTFGGMLITIKFSFPHAIFFGFTGTPIHEENSKKMNTTNTVFGNELHRYSIADGIRDRNVLGFDPYKVLTFKDMDVREQVALKKANAGDLSEVFADPKKKEIYYKYMDSSQVAMAGYVTADGKWMKGIEDYIPNIQYCNEEHQRKVVEDIRQNWKRLSHNGKFHAIFATSSIPEAIDYYRLLKKEMPELNTTCLFDPNIGNEDGEHQNTYKGEKLVYYKEKGLVEILEDYNKTYRKDFNLAKHAAFKKDLSQRLAHKENYKYIDRKDYEKERLDLLIVVDQMLTGFDSKWVNTLYMDKIMEYENIIQAFSRTNRLLDEEKPFGTIHYYRKPHTMEKNIEAAVKLYSGDKPMGLFVEKLPHHLKKINAVFEKISELFPQEEGMKEPNFQKLPDNPAEKGKFAQLTKELVKNIEAAMVQGFRWDTQEYDDISDASDTFANESDIEKKRIHVELNHSTFLVLVQRYKELAKEVDEQVKKAQSEVLPYDLVGYLTEIDTGMIDTDYMNSRFEKYLKLLHQENVDEHSLEQAKNELHRTFSTLSQEEQKVANVLLHEIERGDISVETGKTLRDYITESLYKEKDDKIKSVANGFGLHPDKLKHMISLGLTESNLNEYGRFDALKAEVIKEDAVKYFAEKEGVTSSLAKANIKLDALLRNFILSNGEDDSY